LLELNSISTDLNPTLGAEKPLQIDLLESNRQPQLYKINPCNRVLQSISLFRSKLEDDFLMGIFSKQ